MYGGPLTIAMARSKLDEHKLKDVELNDVAPGEALELGPFELELVHMTHSIPDSCAVALGTELGTVLITGDYKFDQTPVDGPPADVSRLAELGREGVLLLCGDSTNVDRPGFSPSESVVGPHLEEVFARCEGRIVVTSFASNIHRVQQVVDAAAALDRKVALVGPLDAQERRRSGARSATSRCPTACSSGPREIDDFPDERDRDHLDRLPGRAALARCGGWPTATIRQVAAARAATPSSSRPRRSPATSARSTRRSTGSTTSAAT